MSKCERIENGSTSGRPFVFLAHLDIGYWNCWILDIEKNAGAVVL